MNALDYTDDNRPDKEPDRVAYYRAILSRGGGPGGSALETREGAPPQADLSASAIAERLNYTRKSWRQVIKKHLGDKPGLHTIVEKLVAEADRPLQLVNDGEVAQINLSDNLVRLESIVRLDGSRPSFMVRNGAVDFTTSPPGIWRDQLHGEQDTLVQTLQCVGRINRPANLRHGFEGTGFLVGPNLLMTNRHVLDSIADLKPTGNWLFKPDVHVDFGHEWQTNRPPRRRAFRRVVFAAQPLDTSVNHADTDLALLELEPVAEVSPRLPLDCTTDWAKPGTYIHTIGYPANPGEPEAGSGVTLTLLEELFTSTYGCKRFAPGMLLGPHERPATVGFTERNLAHDASTLGGNSGSVLIPGGRLTLTAGLHYAGRAKQPRANWGHVLMHMLGVNDAASGETLEAVLVKHGAQFYKAL